MYNYVNSRGQTYYLNSRVVTLRGGRDQTIYFFTKDVRATACDMPDGFVIVESTRTALPLLKKA